MTKVKIGFDRLSVPAQIARTRLIVTGMTGNANYPAPNPPLASVTLAVNELETAYQESRGRDKDKMAIMRLRRRELLPLIVQLAAYVQQASAGDEEKILSSGFDVVKKAIPLQRTPARVNNLRLRDGTVSGSIRMRWNKTSDAVLYIIESSATADFAVSVISGYTTKTRKEIGGFIVGTNIWIRVYAVGHENEGPTSNPVSLLVR